MKRGFVRIIGGEYRGRKIAIPNVSDLRPTPDRVRETVFNWLSPVIKGAYCLDVFAGTGALGFEARSRRAAYVEMVDHAKEAVEALKIIQKEWGIDHLFIYQAKAPEGLKKPERAFDVVFIDPPYQAKLALPCFLYLESHGFFADKAYVYLEAEELIEDNELPNDWAIIKSKRAGQVNYHLAYRDKHENKTKIINR